MNYVIFISIGVFVALFLMISSHFGVTPEKPSDFNPQKIAKIIRAEQRKNVMIAQEKYGIEVKPTQIAEEPDITKPIHSASQSGEQEEEEVKSTHLFSGDGFVTLIIETVKDIFSSEK